MPHKYIRVYHFLSAYWAMEDLKKGRIKITVFDNVNDPHELRAYAIRGLESQSEELVRFITDRFCLLCFGKDPSDRYMWQSYGDDSHGICFGLNIRRNMVSDVTYVSQIRVEEIPRSLFEKLRKERLRPGSTPNPIEKQGLDYAKPFLLTKFDTWSRERECRAFLLKKTEENGLYYAPLSGEGMYLQEVILGSKCQASEERVRELVASYPRRPILVRRQWEEPNQDV